MRKFSILLVFVYVTIFSLYNFVIAANPASPIVPGDNIQDPGDPGTAWGGCGPLDSNCYVTVSSEISGLDAASATNTINNAAYAQEWQWNTLAGGTALKLSSTSTLATGDTQKLFEVSLSGANATDTQTTYAGHFSNTHTGTDSSNVGLYTTASGGTNNYALWANGNFLLEGVGGGVSFNNNGTNSLSIGSDTPNVGNSFFFGNAGQSATNASNSNFLGDEAGSLATNASNSNFFGHQSGQNATNASNSNFFGDTAGANASSASYSNFFGYLAGESASGATLSNFFGREAGELATNAFNSVFIGFQAGETASAADYSVFIGDQAGEDATNANEAVYVGRNAGQFATNAQNSVFLGEDAGKAATNAAESIFIGTAAGSGDTVNNDNTKYSILLGPGTSTGGFSSSIAMGRGATNTSSNQLVFGSSTGGTINSISSVFFGTGVTAASPTGVVINGSGASGTDIAGASLTFAGGKATGNATGGSLIFQTSDAGSTGATLQSLTTKATLLASGNFGVGVTAPSTMIHAIGSTAVNSAGYNILTLGANYTGGSVGTGFGSGILFQGESTTTENRDMVELHAIWTSSSADASRTSGLAYRDVSSAGALTERFRFTPSAMTTNTSYTLGNSSNTITLGGSTYNIAVTSSGATVGTAAIFSPASTEELRWPKSLSASSGSATYTALAIDNTFDLTGTASGIMRGIDINPTFTNLVSSFRSIDIQANNANAHGIYQSGSSTPNYFNGAVGLGDISPDYKLDIETDIASYTANFFNDGNATTRSGILIQGGLDDSTAAGPSTLIGFQDGDGGAIGSITFGSSATAYNTTSDQRLKDTVNEETTSSIDLLNQIQIHDFTWKGDTHDTVYTGVYAQELYDVYPHAVTKPVNPNDNWMVDYSKLTPVVVASIQDLDIKLNDIENFEEEGNSFGEKLRNWFASSTNGIKKLFVKDEICIGETCINEEQLKALILNNQSNNVVENNNQEENTPILEDLPAQTGDSEDVIIEESEDLPAQAGEVVTEEDVDLPVETGENTETVAEPEIIN